MSGAGRGTPRVSPVGSAPVGPSGGVIYPVSDSKFTTYAELGGVAKPLGGVFAFQGPIEAPLGATRGNLAFRYTQGAPGGLLELSLRWSNDEILMTSPVLAAATAGQVAYKHLPDVYTFGDVGLQMQGLGIVVPPAFSPNYDAQFTVLYVYARDMSATPGTLQMYFAFFDNLSDVPILPNLTA